MWSRGTWSCFRLCAIRFSAKPDFKSDGFFEAMELGFRSVDTPDEGGPRRENTNATFCAFKRSAPSENYAGCGSSVPDLLAT